MNSRRGSILIVLVLVVAIVIVAGIYFLGKQGGISLIPQPTVTTSTPTSIIKPTATPKPLSSPTADLPANWKTYKNETCGFEINYPPEWQVEKDCVKGLGTGLLVNCLESSDFKGSLGVPADNVEKGTVIAVYCDKGFKEESAQSMINGCLEDKQKFPEEKYACKVFEGQYENFAEIKPNEYYLTSNKTLYTIIMESLSQTPPSVAKQILSTFKIFK